MSDVAVDPKKIFAEVMGLPEPEREAVLAAILESLGAPPSQGRTDEGLRAEIERRVKEVDDGTVKLVDWAVVRKNIESRLRRR